MIFIFLKANDQKIKREHGEKDTDWRLFKLKIIYPKYNWAKQVSKKRIFGSIEIFCCDGNDFVNEICC